MRDYSKVSPLIYTGKTGKALREKGPEAVLVALYLMTCPNSNMIGLYHLPLLYLGHGTALGFEGASKGLQSCIEAGFCTYDYETEHVLVHTMVLWQVGEGLEEKDNRCKGVANELSKAPKGPLVQRFIELHGAAFYLKKSPKPASPSKAPPKTLPSQEQEQEQEQEEEKALGREAAFAAAFAAYPKRDGGNSKADALKAFIARCNCGVDPQDLVDGVIRYAAFIRASGKEGTGYVKQAATFFGPGDHYAESWAVTSATTPQAGSARGDIQGAEDHNAAVLARVHGNRPTPAQPPQLMLVGGGQ